MANFKLVLLFLVLTLSFMNVNAQLENKNVTIKTIGSGKTIEDAKNNALRSALEQVSGTYLSSNTLVINDKLVSDNISSITAGTINKYEIINQYASGELFYVTINTEISPTKFAEFVSMKTGASVSIKGGLFVANIKQLNLNEEAELKAVKSISKIYSSLLFRSIYYEVKVNSPLECSKNLSYVGEKLFELPLDVTTKFTKSLDEANQYLIENLEKISLTSDEIALYHSFNRKVFPNIINNITYYFRNPLSFKNIFKLNIFDSGIDYLNSYIICLDDKRYIGYYNIHTTQYVHALVFTNDKKSIKNIASADWCKYTIKGFNSDYCNYPCDFSDFNKFGRCYGNYKGGNSLLDTRGILYDDKIILWDSNSSNMRRITGYFTLKELETISEVKLVKKDRPNIDVFNNSP